VSKKIMYLIVARFDGNCLFNILLMMKATPFPSVYTLVPVLGVVLLVVVRQEKETLAS